MWGGGLIISWLCLCCYRDIDTFPEWLFIVVTVISESNFDLHNTHTWAIHVVSVMLRGNLVTCWRMKWKSHNWKRRRGNGAQTSLNIYLKMWQCMLYNTCHECPFLDHEIVHLIILNSFVLTYLLTLWLRNKKTAGVGPCLC